MNNLNTLPSMKIAFCCFLAFVLSACSRTTQSASVEQVDKVSLAITGQAIYAVNCASCHGEKLQGQPDWQSTNADGTWKAPPLDGTGHTWHHPDSYIRDRILTGTTGPFTSMRLSSNMPAFNEKLSNQEAVILVEFIKSQWTPDIREMQSQR